MCQAAAGKLWCIGEVRARCRLLCRFSAAGMKVYPRAVAAGGRKAPRHEIAVGCGQRLSRALWGFRREFGLAEAGALRSMRSRYLDGRWYASVRTCGPHVGRAD